MVMTGWSQPTVVTSAGSRPTSSKASRSAAAGGVLPRVEAPAREADLALVGPQARSSAGSGRPGSRRPPRRAAASTPALTRDQRGARTSPTTRPPRRCRPRRRRRAPGPPARAASRAPSTRSRPIRCAPPAGRGRPRAVGHPGASRPDAGSPGAGPGGLGARYRRSTSSGATPSGHRLATLSRHDVTGGVAGPGRRLRLVPHDRPGQRRGHQGHQRPGDLGRRHSRRHRAQRARHRCLGRQVLVRRPRRPGASRVVALDHYAWGVDFVARGAYWEECIHNGTLPDQSRDETDFWRPDLPGPARLRTSPRPPSTRRSSRWWATSRRSTSTRSGQFDVVLYLGVLYHMKEPLTCLERLRAVTKEVAVIETEAVHLQGLDDEVLLQFHAGSSLRTDFGNWYVPTIEALHNLCRAAGFSQVRTVVGPPPRPSGCRPVVAAQGGEPARRYPAAGAVGAQRQLPSRGARLRLGPRRWVGAGVSVSLGRRHTEVPPSDICAYMCGYHSK